ncbi:MAG: hypothetical protein AAFO94_23335, partial [Bacteroidota bacterium]
PPAESYCLKSVSTNYHNAYHRGRAYTGSDGWASKYDITEGFAKSTFSTQQNITFNISQLENTSVDAQLTVRLSTGSGSHELSLSLNNTTLLTETFSGWDVRDIIVNIPTSQLQNGNNTIKIEGTASEEDKFRLVSYELTYPRALNFQNEATYEFSLAPDNTSRLLTINNFDFNGSAP